MILILKKKPVCVNVWIFIEQISEGSNQIFNSYEIWKWERARIQSKHLFYILYISMHYFYNIKKKKLNILTHPSRSVSHTPLLDYLTSSQSNCREFPQLNSFTVIIFVSFYFLLFFTCFPYCIFLKVLILSFSKWTVFYLTYAKLAHIV